MKKIDSKTVNKWILLIRRDNIFVDSYNKIIEINVPLSQLHKVTQERIKQLQRKNKFKVYRQLDMFETELIEIITNN